MFNNEIMTIDDLDFDEKTVLIRVDINSPCDKKTKKIISDNRIEESSKTIIELSNISGKVIIIAHQGRKGYYDFINLSQHAKIMEKFVKKKIYFVDDIIGQKAVNAIKEMKNKEILLLDNVRFLEEETLNLSSINHSKSDLVKTLSPLIDIYVNDAFSSSHRSHASLVGFQPVVTSCIGRTMENELIALDKLTKNRNDKEIFIFGGIKVEDCLNEMKSLLSRKRIDKALVCGIFAQIFLLAKGYDIGEPSFKFLEEKKLLKFLSDIKYLLEKYEDKIDIPVDVAENINGKRNEISLDQLPSTHEIFDIGSETIKKFTKTIMNSRTICVKGPIGVYEIEEFRKGTKEILKAVSASSAFSFLGGGDMLHIIKEIDMKREDFSYVCLAGGALIAYLSGACLPVIHTMKQFKSL